LHPARVVVLTASKHYRGAHHGDFRSDSLATRAGGSGGAHLAAARDEPNVRRLFGRARRWPASFEEFGAFIPSLDISETEDAMEVSAELPGLCEKDIDVTLSPDKSYLTIKGEKREEKERKEKGYYQSERSYGVFRRTVALPGPAKEDQIQATFQNGVLTVQLVKDKAKNGEKHIKVKTS
jgi:HSP20 family protein